MVDELKLRIAESDRLERGQEAEGRGLRAAEHFTSVLTYSTDPYLQNRFELGWRDGRSLLAMEAAPTTPNRTVPTRGPQQS